jgi:hypothetical protein
VLTANEARVASSLLGAFLEPEESRIRKSGLPRSSFRAAKRQLFDSSLLEDRYLPHPALLDTHRVSFLLTRPFADELPRVASSLVELRGSACVWSGTQSVFAVILHSSAEGAESFRDGVHRNTFGNPLVLIQPSVAGTNVPVFFDFEGAWNHLCGMRAAEKYPRPMLGSAPLPTRFGSAERIRQLTASLWNRGGLPSNGRGAPHLQGPAALPRVQRLLIRDGAAEWRVIPNLGVPLQFAESAVENVIFVSGELNPESTPLTLFRDLTGTCAAAPFLFAYEGNRVFLASLGLGIGTQPALGFDRTRRPSVRAALLRHLSRVDSIREPTRAMKLHRTLQFGS